MKTIHYKEADKKKNPHGVDTRMLYDSEHAQVIHLTLEPGQSLKKHITSVDVYFYVLEGEGVVEIGDEEKTVTADTLIDSPKDIAHNWHNRSNETLRVLISKVPKPTKGPKIL